MKEASRRRCLRAMGVGVAGLASATAGCSALDGRTGGDGGADYRPLVAHSDWFDPGESSLVAEEPNPQMVSYWDLTATRAQSDSLADWLVESANGWLELNADVDRYAMTMFPHETYFVEYVDPEALRRGARENEAYQPVPDVDGYHARVTDDSVTVVGDGSVLSLFVPESDRSGAADAELATMAARLHGARPSSFTAGTERLERFDRFFEVLGSGTICRFTLENESGYDYARGETFTVGNVRTDLRVAGIGDDLDPETLKQRELELYKSAYDPYDDLEATSTDDVPVLRGSVPTEEFDMLSRD